MFNIPWRTRREERQSFQGSSVGGGSNNGRPVEPISIHQQPTVTPPTDPSRSRTPESERFGLFALNTNNDDSDQLSTTYHLDIVAIHGLNGGAFSTWTNKRKQLWLQEFLPNSLPGARIFTFGYDSRIFSQSRANIGDYARKLLSELTLIRQSEADKKRGIVFICHSLGGIVCKKALVVAHEESRYSNILQSTKAILFFGTPHSGSEQAEFGSVLANIASTAGTSFMVDRLKGNVRHELVRMLRPASAELENLSMSFTERTKNMIIVSFYEENVGPPFNSQIVTQRSARIGVINEELIPLSANHQEMCKLENTETLAYKKLVVVCQACGEQKDQTNPARSLTIQEQECLRDLHFVDMDDCIQRLPEYTPGTCEWILSNDRFREWITNSNSRVLHIAGDMGCGKSILMSYLANQIKPHMETTIPEASQKITLCSFFCDDKDINRKDGRAMLRNLLHQILSQRHDLMEHATARSSKINPRDWSISNLWDILRDIMLDPITGTLVFILDAMDECERITREQVLKLIRQYLAQQPSQSKNCIKFLISSRHGIDITEEIRQCSSMISLDGDGTRDIQRIILLVIKDQLDELAANIKWPAKTRETLEKSIAAKAEGNLLWVSLVIGRLRNGPQTKKFFERVVEESPRDLDGMYCRILADIDMDNQDFAKKILHILVAALRPMTTAELRLALAVNLNHRDVESVEEEDGDMDIERTIRLTVGSLIKMHDHKVNLVHQSTKEFLLRLSTGKVEKLKKFDPDLQTLYGINFQTANIELATACVAFLGLEDFERNGVLDENLSAWDELPGATEDSPWYSMQRAGDASPLKSPKSDRATSTDQKPPFFEYSATYWTTHLREFEGLLSEDLLKSVICLSRPGSNSLLNWSNQHRLSSRDWVVLPKDLDPLIVAAYFGLVSIVNEVLHRYSSELREKSKPIALSWACRMGHLDIVKALLDNGTPVSGECVEGRPPISWACASGCLEITRLLLEKAGSSQINRRDEIGRTPLSLAVGSSQLAITELLLAREDIDVNIEDRTGSTPLFWAIGSKADDQDLMILKRLVSDPRVDIARRDRYGRTVLSWAAEMGAIDAVNILIGSPRAEVKLLLEDTGDHDREWSPLSWAAFNGKLEVVKALCETGKIQAQLASVDIRGQNVFSLAADRDQAEIIKLLVKYYPEGVDYPERDGRTPLSCAMWGGQNNHETVRAFLQTGLVNVNSRTANGRTPLSFAADSGRCDLIRILVEEGGADLDIASNRGTLPENICPDWRIADVRKEVARLRRLQTERGGTQGVDARN